MPTVEEQIEQVVRNYTNHPPSDPLIGNVLDGITEGFIEFTTVLVKSLPEGREKALVLTNLEQASMWSKAAIARNQQAVIDRFANAPGYSD